MKLKIPCIVAAELKKTLLNTDKTYTIKASDGLSNALPFVEIISLPSRGHCL